MALRMRGVVPHSRIELAQSDRLPEINDLEPPAFLNDAIGLVPPAELDNIKTFSVPSAPAIQDPGPLFFEPRQAAPNFEYDLALEEAVPQEEEEEEIIPQQPIKGVPAKVALNSYFGEEQENDFLLDSYPP